MNQKKARIKPRKEPTKDDSPPERIERVESSFLNIGAPPLSVPLPSILFSHEERFDFHDLLINRELNPAGWVCFCVHEC